MSALSLRVCVALAALISCGTYCRGEPDSEGVLAPKPLFRDPVYDGAADPTIIWDRQRRDWRMFYTNRRANVPGLTSVTWVHGTPIGIADSPDGAWWNYHGTVNFPSTVPTSSGGLSTFWAPAVVYESGLYHMYVVVVPGVFTDWYHPRQIVHLTSADLENWKFEGALALSSDRVIDPCLLKLPDGTWRMWYNNERADKTMFFADSPDLYHWTDRGSAHLPRDHGEAPLAFRWRDRYWLLIDLLEKGGLGVYHSRDALNWERQSSDLLAAAGKGRDDQHGAHHPEVVVSGDRAYLYYFVHPGVADDGTKLDQRRSSLQVVELESDGAELKCDRDIPTRVLIHPPSDRP
jgi:hypothetical protein